MAREILASLDEQEKRIVILDNGRIEDYFFERAGQQHLVNNIYKGIVEDVTPALGAVFVNIGLEKKGFLYMDEPADTIFGLPQKKRGQTIGEAAEKGNVVLVQVSKEPFGSKGARLTTNITIPGKHIVIMPYSQVRGVSKKIVDEKERKRLKEIIHSIKAPYGFIVRTAAIGASKRDIEKDANNLIKQWKSLYRKAVRTNPPALIFEEQDIIFKVVRDYFDESVDRLVIDNRREFLRLRSFIKAVSPRLAERVELYNANVPLFELRGIEQQIEEIYNPTVSLPGGGYLIIEETEALTVIDVNSGKFKAVKRNQEEMAFIVNCEAAQEIGRQLRLRDIGGIIVIDFIDMKVPAHKNEVLSVLKTALARDKAKSEIVSVSPLGLVEMTRERTERTSEARTFSICPCCDGRGKIMSPQTVAIGLFRKLRYMLRQDRRRKKRAIVKAHKQVIEYLKTQRHILLDISKKYNTECQFITDKEIKPDQYNLEVVNIARRR